ncbi:MAG: hypothetical protein AMXMBFR84_02680 [Candidatus Hydrogenedentota bacterium]
MPQSVKKSFYTAFDHPFENVDTEPVNCNLCGSDQYRLLGEESGYQIRRCVKCALVYVNPQPTFDALPKFYEGMYLEAGDEAAKVASLGAVERHLRGIVNRRKPQGGQLLDVGCGYGNFLKSMAGGNWTLHGLEVSGNAAAYARTNVHGAVIQQATIEEADIAPESMDCVTLIAVYEHVKDPRATMDRVSRWIKPGGLLLIQVPYIQHFFTLSRRLPFGPKIAFEAPRHLYDFSPRTLPRYFREAGYTEIETDIARPYASPSKLGAYAIWAVKAPGIALRAMTGGRYVWPYAAAIVTHGVKR